MKRLDSSGLTLVELTVAITVSVLLSTVILGFLADHLRASTVASAKQQLLSEAQAGLNKISYDIRLSASADQNNRWADTYAPVATDEYSWSSDSDTLILATASQDANRNVIFDDQSKYITNKNNLIFFVKDNTLYKRVLASPHASNSAITTCPSANVTSTCPADKIILQNVSAFTVSYKDGSDNTVAPTDARSIILQVTLNIKKYSQDISSTYETRMVFRNG